MKKRHPSNQPKANCLLKHDSAGNHDWGSRDVWPVNDDKGGQNQAKRCQSKRIVKAKGRRRKKTKPK